MINTQYTPKKAILSQNFPKAQNTQNFESAEQNVDQYIPSSPRLREARVPQWAQKSKATEVLKWGAGSSALLGAGVGIGMCGLVYTGAITFGLGVACLAGAVKTAIES